MINDVQSSPPSAVRQDLRGSRVLMRAALRAALQYRTSFISTIVGGLVFQGTQLLFIGVLLAKFGVIGGWGFSEIALMFSIRLAAHACYVVPFGNLFQIDWLVRQGEIDRMLMRPVNVWLQIVFARFPLMAVGDGVLGLGATIIFSINAPIDWSAGKIIFLVLAILGGGLAETGIQTFLCGLNFPLGNTAALRVLADDLLVRFSGYPLTIFGRFGLWSLTFIFPMAFIAFLPTAALLGRLDEVPLPAWLAYASPAAGALIFVLGYLFFVRMTRHYSSPGN
ncbi:MAG TPA: ABC-2 family transporter protein [Microlunatus sp.]